MKVTAVAFVLSKGAHAVVRLKVCTKDIENYLYRFIWKISGKQECDSCVARSSKHLVHAT